METQTSNGHQQQSSVRNRHRNRLRQMHGSQSSLRGEFWRQQSPNSPVSPPSPILSDDPSSLYGSQDMMVDTMTSRSDLLSQITELQEAVVGMKSTLTEAVTRLGTVGDDAILSKDVSDTKLKCDSNTAEILKLVLALKNEVTSLKKDVSSVSERQENLQTTLSIILEDRRALSNDLAQAGVISHHTKTRMDTCPSTGVIGGVISVGRPGSGSHSNDSGVALLLERAHQAFGDVHQNNNIKTSDQDSLPEQPSLLVPASVYDYVAGLGTPAQSLMSAHSAVHTMQDHTTVRQSGVGGDSEDLGLVYDSDSSLTIAANKTISLSASLSQEMRVSVPKNHLHSHLHSHTHSHSGDPNHNLTRTDSDGSDQSREQVQPNRRRRPMHHGSDMYIPIQRSRSHGGDRDHLRDHPRDPREAQRYRVARELLDTEKKYCKTLWTIQDIFADPLKQANILTHRDITTLFPEEVYQLYDKHCLLQHQLRERLASWKWQPLVGDILARFTDPRLTDVLRLYTAYVNDFPEVLKTFHKLCRSSPPFTKFIKTCLEQPACGGLDLGAFLLTPVQRVPRYILLLKQLLKYTEPAHPDYRHINACLDRLRDFLARLNDSMEHSFQLVHATLSPSAPAPGPSVHASNHRSGRSPRRSVSSLGSPTYSPDRLSIHCSPDSGGRCSPEGRRSITSPLRSKSSAGPAIRPKSLHVDNSRSSSLPRNSPSTDSRSSSCGSQDQTSSPVRHRSRSGSASRRPINLHKSRPPSLVPSQGSPSSRSPIRHRHEPTSRPIAPARSVSDVAVNPSNNIQRWDDLASSEPSLLDSRCGTLPGVEVCTPSLSGTHCSSQKLDTPSWTDSSSIHDDHNKKKGSSIRTSIKNMFNFKKRYVGHIPDSSYALRQQFLSSPSLYHSHPLSTIQHPGTHTHITTHDSLQPTHTHITTHTHPSTSSHSVIDDTPYKDSLSTPEHPHLVKLNPALAHLNHPTIRVVHISSV